jgi:hypothetical protein
VPRVKYRNGGSECDLIVTDVENGVKSETPLVLLDGMPVYNVCDLHLLNSDLIQRIEVQSGQRIVGNFFYEGLVAIYTTHEYKQKNNRYLDKSGYQIPGYADSPEFSELIKLNSEKNARHPDFKNQLYWNPNLTLINDGKAKLVFITSDELGEYIFEVSGISKEGIPINFKRIIKVE